MRKDLLEIKQDIAEIKEALQTKEVAEEFITPEEFCEVTGMGKNTFYQSRSSIPITPYYFGRKLRFKRAEVIDWYNGVMAKKPFAFVPKKGEEVSNG